jgi:hypothetical protein
MSARTGPYPSGSAGAGLDAASWNDVVRTAGVTGRGVARIPGGALAVLHVPGIAAAVVLVVGNAAVDGPIVVVALLTYAHLTPSWMIDRNTAAAAGSSWTFQSR